MSEEARHRQTLHEVGWVSVLVGLLLYAFTAGAWGQPTTISADIANATLTWTWTQGTGGPVEQWLIRCGPTAGTTTREVVVADPDARSIPLAEVVPTGGTYVCKVAAQSGVQISPPSKAVVFTAGKVLPAPTLQILEVR